MKLKENFYVETIDLLTDGIANQLTDEEFKDLLETLYTSESFKTFALWELVNNAQSTILSIDKVDCFNHSIMLSAKTLIYQVYETLELKRAEMKGCENTLKYFDSIYQFIKEKDIYNFADLYDYCIDNNLEWLMCLNKSGNYNLIVNLMKSLQYRDKVIMKLDKN